jgi:hypothetical protein
VHTYGKKLDDLQRHIRDMVSQCDEAETQLQRNEEASKTLLERANILREERFVMHWISNILSTGASSFRNKVETQMSIVSLFLSRFTLNEEEVTAITSRDITLAENFFAAMDKTETVRNNCRVLMTGEDGPTTTGSVDWLLQYENT